MRMHGREHLRPHCYSQLYSHDFTSVTLSRFCLQYCRSPNLNCQKLRLHRQYVADNYPLPDFSSCPQVRQPAAAAATTQHKKIQELFEDLPGPFPVFSRTYLYNVGHIRHF